MQRQEILNAGKNEASLNYQIELKKKLLELEETKLKILKKNSLWLFKPYEWQKEWWRAGRHHKQRMLMAANRVGKTFSSCVELAYHLLGIYPDWWEGYRFYQPVNAWALGVSGDQLKRVLQKMLLGKIVTADNKCEGGLIPHEYHIKNTIVKGQLKGSIKELQIRHTSGHRSTLTFLSYEQGQQVLMGDSIDIALIDEEPRDESIYPQVLTRTADGDNKRGGLVMLSFTPELGHTTLVEQFMNHLKAGQYFKNVTWEDAPHLTDDVKKQLLAAIPEHQRDMRTKGIPMLGSGAIYPIPQEELYDDCLQLMPHWSRGIGIDFGWNYLGLIWGAWDRDADILHIYDCEKFEETPPLTVSLHVRGKGDWIPVFWPKDGHIPERNNGEAQMELFKKHGMNMHSEHATDENGSCSVEAGISRIRERMLTGRLKISKNLHKLFEEKRLYHRKNGTIVKSNDHLLDALRYLEMMLRYTVTKDESKGLLNPLSPQYRWNHGKRRQYR